MYVPRNQGERGLMNLEEAHEVEIGGICTQENPLIQTVGTHTHKINSAVLQDSWTPQDRITERYKTNKGK